MATVKERYDALVGDRQQFLDRARRNSLLTHPSLMPLEGWDGRGHLLEPYSSLGAKGVDGLSSRVTLSLLPAGRPYLKYALPPEARLQSQGEGQTEIDRQLAIAEQLTQMEVERAKWRVITRQSIDHLIVCGNVLEEFLEDNSIRLFRLDQYVVRRDWSGMLIELVIKEILSPDALPEGVRIKNKPNRPTSETVDLYTKVVLTGKGSKRVYERIQEIEGSQVGSTTKIPVDALPYRPLRWSANVGEEYGRSFVEALSADLRSLEGLTKAVLETAAMAARNFVTIRPGSAGGVKHRLSKLSNGDVIVADPDSIELKSFVNGSGYQILSAEAEYLRQAVAKSFLLSSAGQRDAERVTAAEIERDLQELETVLGGAFSSLTVDMMDWRTRLLIPAMQRQQKLPAWPAGAVEPLILTGLEALSRDRDVSRAMQAAQLIMTFPENDHDVVKSENILNIGLTGLGFPDSIRSTAEVTQIREERAQREMMQQALPQVAANMSRGE